MADRKTTPKVTPRDRKRTRKLMTKAEVIFFLSIIIMGIKKIKSVVTIMARSKLIYGALIKTVCLMVKKIPVVERIMTARPIIRPCKEDNKNIERTVSRDAQNRCT